MNEWGYEILDEKCNIVEEDYGYETEEDAEAFGFRRLGEIKSNSSSELTLETKSTMERFGGRKIMEKTKGLKQWRKENNVLKSEMEDA